MRCKTTQCKYDHKTLFVTWSYDGGRKRARNLSTHDIKCAQVLSGFDVRLRQLGYGSGKVTTWRSSINGSTDC